MSDTHDPFAKIEAAKLQYSTSARSDTIEQAKHGAGPRFAMARHIWHGMVLIPRLDIVLRRKGSVSRSRPGR